MFHNKKLTIFGNEIYCRDNYRYMKRPNKQIVTKSGNTYNLSYPEENVGKFDYLENPYYFGNDISIANKFSKILDWIYEHTQRHYDEVIVETLIKYCPKVDTESVAPFFTIIYLAMLDLEIGSPYPVGSGKFMVYRSCKAVLFHECDYRTAANMFSKKNIIEDEDIDNSFYNYQEEHYERTDSSPEDIIMDALENGNGEVFGF